MGFGHIAVYIDKGIIGEYNRGKVYIGIIAVSDFLVSGVAITIYVILGIIFIIAWADIFIKAGYNRWLCLLMIIPIVNIVLLLWFAFSKWPVYEFVQKDWNIKKLKSKQKELEKVEK